LAPVHYNRVSPKCKGEISKEKRFIFKKPYQLVKKYDIIKNGLGNTAQCCLSYAGGFVGRA
jgi:hypothetical protein